MLWDPLVMPVVSREIHRFPLCPLIFDVTGRGEEMRFSMAGTRKLTPCTMWRGR